MTSAAQTPIEAQRQGGIKPFGMGDKIGYMFGDFGNDFMFLFASSFLMIFYTKVMGIPGAVVGTLFVVARIIDAFADVTVGIVVDKLPAGKGGKYRPVMIKMAPAVVIFSFLMYQTFTIASPMWVKIVYMYFTYIIWGILYSCVNIPYGSMASVISPDPQDRTSLSTFRSVGSTLANLVIGVVGPILIYETTADGSQIIRGGEGTQIFAIVSGVFAVCAFLCFFACYRLTTERVKAEGHSAKAGESVEQEARSTFVMIKDAIMSRSMAGLIGGALCLLLAMIFLQQMATFVYADYFRGAKYTSIANMLGTVMMLGVCAPLVKPLTRKIGHKNIAVLGSLIGAIGMLILFLIRTTNPIVFIVGYTLSFIGLGLFNMIIFAMVTDVIDDIEVIKGIREDATCYSVYSFARKVGQALAGGAAGIVLQVIGYQEGATAVQTPETLQGLYTSSTLLPAIFFVLTFVFMFFVYPLDSKRVLGNEAALKAKREAAKA